MTSHRLRRSGAVAIALVAGLSLTACGTGFGAQTNQVYQAAAGTNHRGSVDVLNALFVADTDGSATLSTSLINESEDTQQLTGVSVVTSDGTAVPSTAQGLPADLDHDQLLKAGTEGTPVIRLASGAKPGTNLTIALTFSDAGDITLSIPVVARTPMYDEIVSAPAPGQATADQSPSAATPSATATPAQ